MEISERQWELLFELSEELGPINSSYSLSYKSFIKYFSEKESLTDQDLIIGASFSYGWMPTILHIYSHNLDEQVSILNRLKNNNTIPNKKELAILKSTFNNSIVGSSKLMHFISPETIPIWDSRVHRNLKKIIEIKSTVNTVENFQIYLDFCQSAIADKRFKQLKRKLQHPSNRKISNMRAIEQVLFLPYNNRT